MGASDLMFVPISSGDVVEADTRS